MTAARFSEIVSTPTFFGPDSASMFGFLAAPANGMVRGGVVVCPSVGKEQAETTRWLKLFAERLAARGFAVLRFDYPNTGESAGAQDEPDVVERWLAGISTAVEFLRDGGATDIVVVGHRAGALLLSQVVATLGVQAAVVWDPVTKGRQYLRAKAVLYNMVSEIPPELATSIPATAFTPAPDARIHTAGQSLHSDAASTLSALKLDQAAFGALPSLLLTADPELATRFAAATGSEVLRVDDQEPYLAPGHPALLAFPEQDIDAVVAWIDERAPGSFRPFGVDVRASATVAHTADGRPITTRVYPTGSGIVVWDTAIGDSHHASQIFVAHSLGQYVRTGPSRLWWETANEVAGLGGRAIRFDRMGVGESGRVALDDRQLPLYTDGYVDDGLRALSEVHLPAGARIAHAGICVGSWMAAHGAKLSASRPGTDSAVVLVNPLMWRLRPQRRFRIADYGADTSLAGTGRTDDVVDMSFRARVRRKIRWLGGRSAPQVRRWVPRRLWPAVGRVPAMSVPDVFFAELDAHDVDIHLAFAPADYGVFDDMSGADGALAGAGGRIRVSISSEGDHTVYHAAMRRVVADEVLRALNLARRAR